MPFEPMGGFPPIIRVNDAKIGEKTLESRGFASSNIVSINSIIDSTKKKDLFFAIGSEEEDGATDLLIDGMFDEKPHEYKDVVFEKIPKKILHQRRK